MSDDDGRLRGAVALVTGASSGIGEATAKRLAAAGLRVVACARRLDRLQALAAEVAAAGGSLFPIACDLRDPAAITAMFRTIREQRGGVDVLINNAGLGRDAPLLSGDTEAWREMLEVNVLALCVCTREAVADMCRRDVAGHVVHVSSMAAHRVPGGSGVYSATKFAVRSLTEGLRRELRAIGSPIRVTAVSPGFVETEFAEVYHGSAEAAAEAYSRYKVLEAVDVAELIWFTISRPPHVQLHDLLVRPTDQTT